MRAFTCLPNASIIKVSLAIIQTLKAPSPNLVFLGGISSCKCFCFLRQHLSHRLRTTPSHMQVRPLNIQVSLRKDRNRTQAMQLQDIVGIVTGGAAGIGRALAETILSAGGKVFITDINTSLLETTGQELAAKFGKANVGWTQQNVVEMDSFHRVFDLATNHFKRDVNVLVNNAGIAGCLKFWEMNAPTEFEPVITIDLTAVIRGSQVAMQQFRKKLQGKEAVIVNVAAFGGLGPVPDAPDYAAAKAGVVGFTRSCHPLKKQHNIRVVALCPGFTKTAMGDHIESVKPDLIKSMGGMMDVSRVSDAFVMAIEDPHSNGRCIRIVQTSTAYFQFPGDKHLYPSSKL